MLKIMLKCRDDVATRFPEESSTATGVQDSVRDFVNVVANELKMQIDWEGHGLDEKGFDEW